MTREEAISEIDCILFEQDHPSRKEVMKALKQPVTLADFLGWEEGKEYRRGGNIFKVDGNHLLDKRPNGSWCNTNCQTFELIDLRQAKKVEEPRYLLQTDLTSENGVQYLSFDKNRRKYFMGALMTSENVQQRFTDDEISKIKLTTRFAMLCEKVEVE